MRQKLSRLELSVLLPARSEKSIDVSIAPIQEASGLRRTANGDLISVARAVFRKYRISISGDDIVPPGIQSLFPGDYIECVVPDFMLINGDTFSRRSLDAHAVLPDGSKVDPTAYQNPADYQTAAVIGGLTPIFSTARLEFLRHPNATRIPGAAGIRCRPIFACRVISPTTQSKEETAQTTWSLDLEEI